MGSQRQRLLTNLSSIGGGGGVGGGGDAGGPDIVVKPSELDLGYSPSIRGPDFA